MHVSHSKICVIAVQIQIAGIFLVGCPACNQNFKHFFCTLTCSPDQSTFTNVSAIQKAFDNNETVVKEVDIFVADSYGEQFYNSCKVCCPCYATQHVLLDMYVEVLLCMGIEKISRTLTTLCVGCGLCSRQHKGYEFHRRWGEELPGLF